VGGPIALGILCSLFFFFMVMGEITKVGYTFVTIGSPNFPKTTFRPN
jgi:hypothetical protein